MAKHDPSTRDLGSMVLLPRGDLIFTPRRVAGELSYIVEDQVNAKYFTIGLPEYAFVSCLDGSTSVDEALSLCVKATPGEALREHDATAVCRWLIENELAHTAESKIPSRLAKQAAKRSATPWLVWNPLYTKVPMFHPQRFFQRIVPWTRWLFSPVAVMLSCALALFAVCQLCDQWDRFVAASGGVLFPSRWIWLAICWAGLKIIHELSHGIVCQKYGGTVRESGVVFILLAPLAYVDVTSSWRFRSKWDRIFTATAGMYVEIIVASLAVLVWCGTQPGMVNDVCFNLILMASVSTLLFNANPLMRFDGYYILADLVDIPNLYADGQLFLRNVGRRVVFGLPTRLSTGSPSRDSFIWMYGVAAFCWRQLVTIGLIMLAATMFEGAGLLIAIAATITWVAVPVAKMLNYLVRGNACEPAGLPRFALVVGPLGGLLILAAMLVPWPVATRAPAIVDYAPLSIVRAGCAGFVSKVHVQPGELVAEGQLLAELENPELLSEQRDLELAIEQSLLRARAVEQRDELAAYQAELKELESLRKKLGEKQQEASHLFVLAPQQGRILVRNAESLVGTYLTAGAEIVGIGAETNKEVRVNVLQEDVNAFTAQLGSTVSVRLSGGRRMRCQLSRLSPRASIVPTHLSLCAPHGGPLEVRTTRNADDNGDVHELVRPRFAAIVPLSPAESQSLRAGQRGVVSLTNGEVSIAHRCLDDAYKMIWRRAGTRTIGRIHRGP